MIKELSIKNFKCFKELKIELGNYNLLCGTNGSGKSSIIQSLLLLSQNSDNSDRVILNGRIIKLGDFSEVKNFEKGRNEAIEILVKSEEGKENAIKFDDELNAKERKNDFKLTFDKNIFYLSANRIGAADTYEDSEENIRFGINGEYAISFLRQHYEAILTDEFCYDKNFSKSLRDQVNYWLKRICDSEIDVDKIEKTTKVRATYKNYGNYNVRNTNTGSGISYVVSILIICLGMSLLEDTGKKILLIENPEIHLHPKAQSVLAEFMMFVSNNVQLIVETHSDHFFNAYRIALKNHKLETSSSKVYFFKRDKTTSAPKQIEFTNTGKILTKEKDLFDQYDIDLFKMI